MADLTDERMMILQMISEGKITAEEGARLLEALTSTGDENSRRRKKSSEEKKKRKSFFINPMDEVGKHIEQKIRKKIEVRIDKIDDISKILEEKLKILTEVGKELGQKLQVNLEGVLDGINIEIETDGALEGEKYKAEFEMVLDVPEGMPIVIDHKRGDLSIIDTDEDKIRVSGLKCAWGENEEDAEKRSGKFIIKGEEKESKFLLRMISLEGEKWSKRDYADLEIQIPKGHSLTTKIKNGDLSIENIDESITFNSFNGDVEISNVIGALEGNTSNGDISANNIQGTVELNTKRGDIIIKDIDGAVEVKTISGDTEFHNIKGDIKIRTSSGDSDLDGIQGNLKIQSLNGDINVKGGLDSLLIETKRGDIDVRLDAALAPTDYTISTIAGDIDFHYPIDSELVIEARTQSGDVSHNIEWELEKDSNSHLIGKKGDNPAIVELKAISGDISIKEV